MVSNEGATHHVHCVTSYLQSQVSNYDYLEFERTLIVVVGEGAGWRGRPTHPFLGEVYIFLLQLKKCDKTSADNLKT